MVCKFIIVKINFKVKWQPQHFLTASVFYMLAVTVDLNETEALSPTGSLIFTIFLTK